MCGTVFQFKSFFMDTTTAFCVKLQKIVFVCLCVCVCVCGCVGVCGCAKRKTERRTSFLVGEKFYLFL